MIVQIKKSYKYRYTNHITSIQNCISISIEACRISLKLVFKFLLSLSVRGHVRGLPGDVHPVRLRDALLLGVPARRPLRPPQQPLRDPRRRIQALLRPPEALRTARRGHRHLAGKNIYAS